MKIHCQKGKFFGGLGDTICLAWLAEAAKGTKKPIELVATGLKAELLRMLGQEPTEDETDAAIPSTAYELELADQGKQLRLWYVTEWLGIQTGWKRPPANIPAEAFDEANKKFKKITRGKIPLVLLFPQTHWASRLYPPALWIDLSWKLKRLGVAPITILEKQDERFENSPLWVWGLKLPVVAALMRTASVVVGNDSMPCHLAGTLGCKTLALLGPTRPTVFGHDENISCLTSGLSCTGCHFKGGDNGYRAACVQMCQSLMGLTPDTVVEAIMKNVNGG